MAKNIVLIGFMGVGKGQVARSLAYSTGRFVLDSDDLIESFTNKNIKRIFAEDGETQFRKLEKRTALWLEKNVSSSIISTGGGFVNVTNLKKIGTVILLHADFQYIIDSIINHPNAKKKIKKRPLLQNMSQAEELYQSRLPLYREAANFVVDITEKNIEGISSEICRHCKVKMKKKK